MEKVQHSFTADPKLIGSALCMICKQPQAASIHLNVKVVRGTATPKKIG